MKYANMEIVSNIVI